MLYIHTLKDLTPKTADIESVPIIREVKSRLNKPFSEQEFHESFDKFFPESKDINEIKKASEMIEPAIEKLKELINQNNPAYEAINLYRTVSMLEEVNQPIIENIIYLEEIRSWKDEFIREINLIFKNIKSVNNQEEYIKLNERINYMFRKMLRNDEFVFNSNDIINEGKLARIRDLHESLGNGFFFHITVKEHLDNVDFSIIKTRIKREELEPAEEIAKEIFKIKNGVQTSYDLNMNIVNLSVIIYSYIKALLQ